MVYKKILQSNNNNNDRKIIVSHGKSLTKSRRAIVREGDEEKQRNKLKHEKQVIKNIPKLLAEPQLRQKCYKFSSFGRLRSQRPSCR